MNKSTILRLSGFVGTAGATAALVGMAATGTGAYFSDAKSGAITGTMGSISVSTDGGEGANGLGINFTNMLPGEAQTQTVHFANSGKNNQDVWVVFTDADKLHGLNQLGTYAEVHVKSSGTAVFDSANLNDNTSSCKPGAGNPACAALPHALKLADNVAPKEGGTMTFSFTPGAKFKSVQGVTILDLPYSIVATQHGITPDNGLNSTVVK